MKKLIAGLTGVDKKRIWKNQFAILFLSEVRVQFAQQGRATLSCKSETGLYTEGLGTCKNNDNRVAPYLNRIAKGVLVTTQAFLLPKSRLAFPEEQGSVIYLVCLEQTLNLRFEHSLHAL